MEFFGSYASLSSDNLGNDSQSDNDTDLVSFLLGPARSAMVLSNSNPSSFCKEALSIV